MDIKPDPKAGPIVFTFAWLGVATVVVVVVGVVAGLLRDDVAGTLGPVISWGLGIAAVILVAILAVRRT